MGRHGGFWVSQVQLRRAWGAAPLGSAVAALLAATVLLSGCGTSPKSFSGNPAPSPGIRLSQSAPPSPPSSPAPSPSHAPRPSAVPSPSPGSPLPTASTPAPPTPVTTSPSAPGTTPGRPTTPPPAPTPPTPRPSPSATATIPTQADLETALLSPADVGSGYVAQLVTGPGNAALLSGCPTLNDNPAGVLADAADTLTAAGTETSFGDALYLVDPRDAASDMAAYAAVPQDCGDFSSVISGVAFHFITEPLTVASLGDQTTAMRLTMTINTGSLVITQYLDFVVILHHSTIIVVLVSNAVPDIDLTQDTANTAYQNVASRW
jgi:hypothetical protein